MRSVMSEREETLRYPIRRTFFGCCASVIGAVVRRRVASSHQEILGFIIFASLLLVGGTVCLVHRMILVARANISGGIVRAICFAALRLMTNSNFVGCSTGIS